MSSKLYTPNNRLKNLTREQLDGLSKTELIDKILQLEAYNLQLKNILYKKLNESEPNDNVIRTLLKSEVQDNLNNSIIPNCQTANTPQSGKVKKRQFDFSRSYKRHILLKFLYFGWDYNGFACQEDSNATIEHHLFNALLRTCLIESRATANYHRCGRTDKEVSAYCQVISIDVRSKLPPDQQLLPSNIKLEIDYCSLLNRVLPKQIRCLAWMPLVNPMYSARFDCMARTYRYFFPKGNLNIPIMQAACKLLISKADFRNFCKMDVQNGVTNFTREILKAKIDLCPNEIVPDNKGYTMYYLEIIANGFLWHQIRCIMAVLLLIGKEVEQIDIITDLLNVEKIPCKPQYSPALGMPLNLYHCEFRSKSQQKADQVMSELNDVNDTNPWVYNQENMEYVFRNLQSQWSNYNIKATMIRTLLEDLEDVFQKEFHFNSNIRSQDEFLQNNYRSKYQKLLHRPKCESLENRIEHYIKRQRLVATKNSSETSSIFE